MKIKVEKWIFDGERSYKIIDAEKCCDKILNSQVVVLNDEYENGDDTDYCMKLQRYYHYWDYEDEIDDYTYEPIKYCPFCRSKIDIDIVDTIDKTEEYLEIVKQREKAWEKYKKVDSRKKMKELRIEIEALDRKADELYYSDVLDVLKVSVLNQEIKQLKQYSDELSEIQKEQQIELNNIVKELYK